MGEGKMQQERAQRERTLVVWFRDGSTALFTRVTDFQVGGKAFEFSYFGESTQVQRTALFERAVVAGYALEVA